VHKAAGPRGLPLAVFGGTALLCGVGAFRLSLPKKLDQVAVVVLHNDIGPLLGAGRKRPQDNRDLPRPKQRHRLVEVLHDRADLNALYAMINEEFEESQ